MRLLPCSWLKSIVDLSDLVSCPDCPGPGLVPRKEMTKHIALLHKGEAFSCAVCKVGGVETELIDKIVF